MLALCMALCEPNPGGRKWRNGHAAHSLLPQGRVIIGL